MKIKTPVGAQPLICSQHCYTIPSIPARLDPSIKYASLLFEPREICSGFEPALSFVFCFYQSLSYQSYQSYQSAPLTLALQIRLTIRLQDLLQDLLHDVQQGSNAINEMSSVRYPHWTSIQKADSEMWELFGRGVLLSRTPGAFFVRTPGCPGFWLTPISHDSHH